MTEKSSLLLRSSWVSRHESLSRQSSVSSLVWAYSSPYFRTWNIISPSLSLSEHAKYVKSDCVFSHQSSGPLVLAGEGAGLVAAHLLLLPPLGTQQLLEAVLLLPQPRHELPRLAQLCRQSGHVSLVTIILVCFGEFQC